MKGSPRSILPTLNGVFASCVAFIFLLIFTIVLSPILGPKIATLFGVKLYRIGWASDVPRSDEIVFPGDTITVKLKEDTLEGWYGIQDLDIKVNGNSVSPIDIGSVRYGDKIIYHTEYPRLQEAGVFKFQIPSENEFPSGGKIHALYSLNFQYPKRFDQRYFVWDSKKINGSLELMIGTADQRKVLHAIVALLWAGTIITVVICWIVVFTYVSR